MQVELFNDIDSFNQFAIPYMVQNEAANNLPLGLCGTLQVNPYTYGAEYPYLALVRDQDQILAIAVMTPPFNLTIATSDHTEAILMLADHALTQYPNLPGITAINPIADLIVEHCQQQGYTLRQSMAERIYQLDQVQAVRPASGHMRPIAHADRQQLIDWLIAFYHEALPDDPIDVDRTAANIDSALNDTSIRKYFVWEDQGTLVSLAGYAGPTPNSLRVGPVYTPPEQRGKGYASALVAQVSQHILEQGCSFVTLFTDLSNPTSNHIYQTIGYYPVIDVNMYQFER